MFGKITDNAIESFTSSPAKDIKSILIHGNDENVIHYRENQLKIFYKSNNYQIISNENESENVRFIQNEAMSGDFFSDKKAILINNIKDKEFQQISDIITDLSDCIIIFVNTNSVTPASKIKVFHENAQNKSAAIACYPLDKIACKNKIIHFLKSESIILEDQNDIEILAENIGINPMDIDNELNKIKILSDKTKILTSKNIETIQSACEDASFLLIDYFFSKSLPNIAKYSDACIQNSINSVLIIRGFYKYTTKLINAKINIAKGSNASDQAKMNGIFFKKYHLFAQHVNLWSIEQLEKICVKLFETDRIMRSNPSANLTAEILNCLRV